MKKIFNYKTKNTNHTTIVFNRIDLVNEMLAAGAVLLKIRPDIKDKKGMCYIFRPEDNEILEKILNSEANY